MSEAQRRAVELAQHYFRLTAQQAGVKWDGDNDAEVELMISCIVDAAASGLRAELAGPIAEIRVLDRLRPTCVICQDATADRQTASGPACTDCVGDLPDGGPDPDFPESWAFDEVKGDQADEPEHGPAADTFTCCTTPMPWPTQDQDRICPDCGTIWEREPVDIGAGARIKSAGGAETSDGAHTGDWYDGGRCGACGLFGPDDEPEPEERDPGPEADDEGGMSEYRGWLP